ncbi:MAG: hypothetical protein IIB88_09790, partial [Chloroflexi bacterium]|nr:hypothetical protein [Chloroflexota bacterium]
MRRLLFGITLGVVVVAVTLMSLSLFRGDGTSAQEADTAANVNDGSLAGVADILVGSVNTGAGLFYCIIKTDHDGGTNAITVYAQ